MPKGETVSPKLRLLKFESLTCAACISMNKKGTVDTLKGEFPGMEVFNLIIADAHGDSPDGSTFEAAYKLSDELEVQALPTYIVQDERGIEFARIEGTETLTAFRKVLERVVAEIEGAAELLARVDTFRTGAKS